VLADLELELQLCTDSRRIRHAEALWDGLRLLGPLTRDELTVRCDGDPTPWVEQLLTARRVIEVVIDGRAHLAVAEDAARLRDALGCALPIGLPTAFTEPVPDPLVELVARYARTHGPFLAVAAADRLGTAPDRVTAALARLERAGRLVRGEFRPGGIEREWCDTEVLRQLRRRSLAALRREVEPVDRRAFVRFLPAWQGIGRAGRGVDALVDTLGLLAGAAIPASVLEADVLPARLATYRPADLDALCTSGEVVWVGAGAIGSTDGRLRLAFRDQAALLLAGRGTDPPDGPLHHALLDHLGSRGASFWAELVAAAHRAQLPDDDASVLAALWDLVWAGLVTNDSLAPVRAVVGRNPAKGRDSRAGTRARPRVGRLSRSGPPAAAGRWSLVAPLLTPAPSTTELLTARAVQLLERYGVLTRESALGEGADGGFAGVYPVLKLLEERGQVRRGYFVDGLGAAQFALPGAVDRLRAVRDGADGGPDGPDGPGTTDGAGPLVLAATDPGQPFGATLPWPDSSGRPARVAGAHVVIDDGEAMAFLERSGKRLITFEAGRTRVGDGDLTWPSALAQLVERRRYRQIELAQIDAVAASESPLAAALRAVGFRDGYRGLVLRTDR